MTKGIITYFEGIDRITGHYPGKVLRRTEFGEFSPAPLGPLEARIDELRQERAIPESGIFCDAGFGDGRVALLMGEKGYDAYSLEGDIELVCQGKMNRAQLIGMKKLRADRPVILEQGNFSDAGAYINQLGVDVGKVGLFFNYQSNGEALAELIAEESPVGTKYLYLSHHPWTTMFVNAPELVHRKTKKLNIEKGRANMYLRLYEKVAERLKHLPAQKCARLPWTQSA